MPTASPNITNGKNSVSDKSIEAPQSTAERDAYSIPEFCRRHNISRGTYYNLKARGLGPREARAMSRVIVSIEAAADWRRQRETIESTP